MKRLYFVRHGETESNVQQIHAGHFDSPLTATGVVQAEQAGEAAKPLHIDYIVSSPLMRAYDTAKIIADKIGFPEQSIEVNDLSIEQDVGTLTGQSWDADPAGFSGIETTDSMENRAQELLRHLETISADNVLLVSHGSFGHAMWRVAQNRLSEPYYPEKDFKNAQIVPFI